MSRARLSLASSQAEAMEKKVGEDTSTMSSGPAGPPAEQHAADHEGQMRQGLAGDARLRRRVEPGAQDRVAVPVLAATERAAILRRQDPGGMVRHPGQPVTSSPAAAPGRGELGQPGLRRADLGREVVADDQGAHVMPSRSRGRARRSRTTPRPRWPARLARSLCTGMDTTHGNHGACCFDYDTWRVAAQREQAPLLRTRFWPSRRWPSDARSASHGHGAADADRQVELGERLPT